MSANESNKMAAKLLADLMAALGEGRATLLSLRVEPLVIPRNGGAGVAQGSRISLMARMEDK